MVLRSPPLSLHSTYILSNILNNLNDDWEQRINKYDYDDDSLSDIESDDGQSGFAIEFGELDFENDKRRSNLNDDTASLGTMGLKFPTDFIDLDADDSDDGKKILQSEESNKALSQGQPPTSHP